MFILPLSLRCVNWASQEGCLFSLRSLRGPWTFLYSIFMGFSLHCLLATAILDSIFLLKLPNIPPQEMGGPILQGWGVDVSLATSC